MSPPTSQAAGSAGKVELVPIVPASSTTCEPLPVALFPPSRSSIQRLTSAQQTPAPPRPSHRRVTLKRRRRRTSVIVLDEDSVILLRKANASSSTTVATFTKAATPVNA